MVNINPVVINLKDIKFRDILSFQRTKTTFLSKRIPGINFTAHNL